MQLLWVDDEPETVYFESRVAETLGFTVTWSMTVADAIERTRAKVFDLIVVDIILPMDEYEQRRGHINTDAGVALIETLRDPRRKAATSCDVPLVVVSATIDSDILHRILNAFGQNGFYLVKPLMSDAFRDVLVRICQNLGEVQPRPGGAHGEPQSLL